MTTHFLFRESFILYVIIVSYSEALAENKLKILKYV